MAYIFPTLSMGASFENFSNQIADDPTYRSTMEDGSTITRAQFTATKEMWRFNYRFLVAADKALLKTMQNSVVVGAGEIAWTNPEDGVVYTVKLTRPIQFRIEPEHHLKHSAILDFKES